MSNATSTNPENSETPPPTVTPANTVRRRVSEPGSGARQQALRLRTVPSSGNLSDRVLALHLPAAADQIIPADPPPQLVKKGLRVEGDPDLHAATVRRLVLDGNPIASARTMADIAMAIEEGRSRRNRRGRKRLPPRLYLRKGNGKDSRDAIGIRDGSHRELTGFEPREGEDHREHEGARQRLLEYVEKRVRGILGRALKKDVTVSAAFVEFLDNHRPGSGTHSLDVTRINEIENHLLQLEEFMGSDSLADLGINTPAQYVDFRVTQQIKSQSKAHKPAKEVRLATRRSAADHTDTLMFVLNWYCEQHGIEPIKMRKPKVRAPGIAWLTWEEVVRLLRAARGAIFDENGKAKGRHQKRAHYECVMRFIVVYLYGGTRHQNILQLLWGKHSHLGHIDPHTGIIERQGDKADVTCKRRGTSFIYGSLASLAKKWEAADREAGRNSPHRFKRVVHDENGRPMANKKGRPNRKLAIRFNEVAKLAGLPHAKPHMLKHTGVSLFAKCGMPPAELSITFSTSIVTLLTRYTHLRPYFASVMPFRKENLRLLRLRRFSPPPSHDRDS